MPEPEGADQQQWSRQIMPGLFDAARVTAVPLDGETVAQIVWFLGNYRVQVNDALPLGLRAAVARHFAEFHLTECYPRYCVRAREWVQEMPAASRQAAAS